jgi:hypothetical protein
MVRLDDWTFRILHVSQKGDHRILLDMLPRIYDFSAEHEPNINPSSVVADLHLCFVRGGDLHTLFIFEHGNEIVGHMLFEKGSYRGREFWTAVQYVNAEAVPRKLRAQGWKFIKDVGRALGVQTIVGVCPDERVARAHRIFHQMERYATVMHYHLDSEEANVK